MAAIARIRARLLPVALAALFLFQAGYAAPAARAVEPSPTPSTSPVATPAPIATTEPSTLPSAPPTPSLSPASPSPTSAPSSMPTASLQPTPSATPSAAASATPEPTPTHVPAPIREDEVVELRTETSSTFDLGDGRLLAEFATEPIHYRPVQGGALESIELAFADVDGGLAIERSPVRIRVAGNDDPQRLVALTGPDGLAIGYRQVEGSAQRGQATSAADDRLAVVERAVDDHDLRVAARPDGANLFIVLDDRPTVLSWTMALDLPAGARLVDDRSGGLEVVDRGGIVKAHIAAPYAVDSRVDERTGSGRMTTSLHYELGATDTGQPTLTVVVDDERWLDEASYPVYVDPSTTLVLPGSSTYGDTFVNAGNPTQNYANYQRPDAPGYYELWLGESPSNPTYVNTALLKFDLTGIEGTAVIAADLQVRPYHAYYAEQQAREDSSRLSPEDHERVP